MTDTGMHVRQADYEAAKAFFRDGRVGLAVKFQLGAEPQALLEAFARHRAAVITAAMAQDKAEIERLREALDRIAAEAFAPLDQLPPHDQPNGWRDIAVERIDIARQALAAASLKAKDASDD